MGLLTILGISHPITDRLEKELTQIVLDRYKSGDKTLVGDLSSFAGNLSSLPKAVGNELKSQVKQLLATEEPKVKKNWKEFKALIKTKLKESIIIVLKNSAVANYSQEKSWEIIAIPKDLLVKLTTDKLAGLLEAKIEFDDMEHATITTLAKYAVELRFNSVLNSLKSDKDILNIGHRDYILVEEKKNDHYFIDDATIATRNRMLFFSEVEGIYSSTSPREKRRKAGIAIDKWIRHQASRPDNRRFKHADWN